MFNEFTFCLKEARDWVVLVSFTSEFQITQSYKVWF